LAAYESEKVIRQGAEGPLPVSIATRKKKEKNKRKRQDLKKGHPQGKEEVATQMDMAGRVWLATKALLRWQIDRFDYSRYSGDSLD